MLYIIYIYNPYIYIKYIICVCVIIYNYMKISAFERDRDNAAPSNSDGFTLPLHSALFYVHLQSVFRRNSATNTKPEPPTFTSSAQCKSVNTSDHTRAPLCPYSSLLSSVMSSIRCQVRSQIQSASLTNSVHPEPFRCFNIFVKRAQYVRVQVPEQASTFWYIVKQAYPKDCDRIH